MLSIFFVLSSPSCKKAFFCGKQQRRTRGIVKRCQKRDPKIVWTFLSSLGHEARTGYRYLYLPLNRKYQVSNLLNFLSNMQISIVEIGVQFLYDFKLSGNLDCPIRMKRDPPVFVLSFFKTNFWQVQIIAGHKCQRHWCCIQWKLRRWTLKPMTLQAVSARNKRVWQTSGSSRVCI